MSLLLEIAQLPRATFYYHLKRMQRADKYAEAKEEITSIYLGLTAFTIFYRKLAHPENCNGTAVIMRYTLRLLAAQQFTRAATLICACEYIRQDCVQKRHKYPAYPLGRDPITIGLWIGGAHIPNKNEDAAYHLKKLQNVSNHFYVRNEKERHNKFQVLKCPWCGTKMVKDDSCQWYSAR